MDLMLGGRGLKGAMLRTLPSSFRTLMPKFTLIGGTVGKKLYLGVGAGELMLEGWVKGVERNVA